jgi:hypothetical protein
MYLGLIQEVVDLQALTPLGNNLGDYMSKRNARGELKQLKRDERKSVKRNKAVC